MASDIRIPDPVTIKKQEDEDSYLINEQGDKIQKEIYKMEEEKFDLLLNQPPGVGDFPSSVDTIDAELNDGIKTKDNEILVTSHLEQVGNEEKCRSDPCPSIPKEDETEMLDNEKQFHQCDHTGDAKEKEQYEAVVVDETCENLIQKIDEQEALHDIKTSSPVSKVEEDIIVEKEESSNDEINVDQNVEEILDRQTFIDNNDKPQNIHEERNGSESELKKEASAESIINILNDDIETVTTNTEDSPCSHEILDEEDGGMKTELKLGDSAEISRDSKVEKVNETSRDTYLEKDEEPSTSNADYASDVAIPEVQNDETTTEIGTSAEGKLEMSSVSEDTDEGSRQEGTLEEGVNLNRPSDEFTNQTETREESSQYNNIPNEGDKAEFSEQKLDSINVERQVNLQEMIESTTNESREVEELTATATGDYIDGSQNNKAVQDLEYKYFEENDPAEETTLVAVNKGLEENETETPREISGSINNEGEKQITNLETSSGIEKEHIEAAYFGASKDDVPTEEELSPSNLYEVHDSTNELSDNNGNDVQLEHSLLRETEKVEDQKVDGVLEFENEQKIQEENNAMIEEKKYVDNVSEAYPNTEHTTGEIESLDKTVTSEMISEINSSNVEDEKISGFGLEEKIESSEIRVYVPEELEMTEDTETYVQSGTIKDNKAEEQIAVDDALTTESRNADEEEIVEKSFEEQDYEEATLNLSGEDENLLPNEIEKKKTYDEEGSDNIDTENIKEEALVKSKDACFSPETNEVDGSSEKEVEKLREEDSGRSILDEADEKYVGEEVIKHYENENEDIEISKGEIFCEVENVTGEKFITNEKNEDVETQEDVAFSEEHDVLATKEAYMEESRNDSTCPTKEVVADNAIDNTTNNSERAMVAEEVAEKVLDEGKSKEEPVNFLVARESETETLSENDQIISAAEKDIKQIKQKDDSGGELMQPLVIDETETEILRQNAYNETLAVEELEETKQTETEACFDSTVVVEKDTENLQKDETSEEVKQLEFTDEIEEKASYDNAENKTSVARDDVEKISLQEETKEELEQSLETKKIEPEAFCGDAEIIKLEDYTEKDLLNEVTKESEATCRDIEIIVPKEDAEQVLLKEAANDIVQPQAPNEIETEGFSENDKEILAVEELQETKTIETESSVDSTMVVDKDTERSLEKVETSEEVQQLQLTKEVEEQTFCDDAEEILVAREDTPQILHQDEPKKELDHLGEIQKIEYEEQCEDEEVIAPGEDTQPDMLKEVTKELDQSLVTNENEKDIFSGNSEIVVNEKDTKQVSQNIESVEEFENVPETEKIEAEDNNSVITAKGTENLKRDETSEEVKQLEFTDEIEEKASCDNAENETSVARNDVEQISLQEETKEELEQSLETKKIETETSCGDAEIIKLEDYAEKDLLNEVTKESEASCRDIEITVPKEDAEQVLLKEAANDIVQPQAPNEIETEVFSENVNEILTVEELQETKTIETETSSDSTKVADKDTERTLEKVETSEEVQQLQLTKEVEEQTFCDDVEEILVAREDTPQILHQDEPKKELDHSREIQKIESEEQCEDEEVIAHEEDTQPVVLKEVTKELDQSLVTNENEMDTFSDNSEIVVNEKDTKQISQNIESVEEFENVPETDETETEDNNLVTTAKDTENVKKDETREEVKEFLLTSELEAKTICDDDEKETSVTEDYAEKDSETNLQTYETKEEIAELINANETETEVFHGDIKTTLAEKDIDKNCQKNESTEEIEQYLGIKESNTEGFGDSSGIAIDERDFEETLQKEVSREELEQSQEGKEIETEAEKVRGNTEIDTVMGERGLEEPFEISESSEKFEQSIVTPEPPVKKDVDEDSITGIGGEETAKKEEIETARECHENVILDEISSIESRSQETISEDITTTNFQKDENEAIGYKELEIEDVSSIEQENTTGTLFSTPINETITEICEKENSDIVELKQELQLELKEQIEEQNSKEISTENIQLQEDPDTKALDEEIYIEERSENLAQNFFSESKVNEKEMQEEIQEKEKADSSLVSILSEEKISKEELEIKELSNEEGTDLGTSSINVEEERDSKSENEKDKDISPVAYEDENQIEYETDDQIHPTTIKNDQEVTIEEATLHHTQDYKLTDLSILPSKELDTETTKASDASENVTNDAAGEDIINEEVENPLNEQEIENKLVQEADESFTQRDLLEMGSLNISAPSEVQQQRDEELHPPPETENKIEYEADDQEVIIEEATLDHTPDYKVTELLTLTSKELDIETTEASNTTENVTIDAAGEDIINEEVENPLKEQEIEYKLVQEADESFTQRDLSEMGTSDICAPSEVQQQRDEELHPPPETENQIEYEADDQVHPTTIKNDQEVILEEETLDLTPDDKVTDLSTLTLKELDIETTKVSNTTENVTINAEGEDIINEEVENPLKEQEIEYKLVQEADESFTQRDLSEMETSDMCAPSEVQQQRDEELHPPPETENQIEDEADDQVHPTTIKNDQEVIIEEETLDLTPYDKVTDLSTLTSKELDMETTEASNTTENVTTDAKGEDIINEDIINEDIINEEVENPLKEQEIENKLIQEADESFTQREMGSSDIVQCSAPSDVQQQRDEELHPPPEIDRRSTFDSNEVANLNKEELIDFEKQHEVIDDKNYLESEEAGEDETKQILHSEKSEDNEQLLESKITETEAYAIEKDTGEGYQEIEVIETARECKENVISDEIDCTKSTSQETVTEYFQKDGTGAIGYKEPETEHTSLTEQVNFKENTTAVLSFMPINETTTESSENENSDALKLKQELQLESEEQIEVENWNELQKDLDTKEAINEEIHVEERSENVAQNLLSESEVYEAETQEGTQEKEDASSVAITGRDLSEMGSDQKSAPSEVQKQRDPELHPPPEIDISTSESNEVANLDKIELSDFQNQYEVVDDKNNLQTEELEEIIFENPCEVVDEKNNLESEEAAKDDSKDILRNEKPAEETEQLMETKITVTEALVAEKDTREVLQETETSVAEKDTTQVLEHTEPCVFERDSSASNEMENLKKEELDFENEYEIVDDKNNLELEGETSKKEEPSEQPIDQYSIGDKPASELNMTCTDFEETSRSIELEEATAAAEVVSQGAGHDDSTVQFNELPTKEAKETNLESNIQIEATEALNEETSNQASNENYVASSVSEVSDKEVKEVRKDELITDDCKPSIADYESENSGLNVAESEEKDMVEDKTVLDSTAIDNEPESEQKDIADVGTVLDFSAEERRDKDIEAVVEGKEGGEYEMEEKLGILTEDTCTEEGNENLASTESKVADQDFEEEISINDYDSPSAKFGSEDLSLKAPESKEQEAETKEDQSVMEIRPEDISILCKEKEEDTTTLVVEGIDNRDHNIEETTPTKGVVEEKILTRSFDFRSDDNLPESVEISSDKHQLVETETAEKVEDIVVRDETSYGNFELEEKLNNPIEDTCTKEGNENLTASIESKVFDEEIKEEIASKEEISTSDFDSPSTKFESGDKALELEEQKIQTINDQSAMEIKPEDNSILCKENDDGTTTLAVESIVNQDHDIEETIPNKVIVEENILTRSFDFTSDSNLQETVEIPSSENQLIASETSDKVEKNIVRDEASYGNFEQEATSPTQTIEEKLDATIEDTCTKEGDENLVPSSQSKMPDDEIKELISSKEEISINDYDSPSTKFERKDLSLKVVESEEQESQAKEDQTSIDTKQEDEDIVTLAVESTDNREHEIEETTSKEVVVDENVLIRSFDSTGDNLQDSAEISSDKHELLATETTERVASEETEHVMDKVHKAVAEEAFLTTSSDTLNDNDCHDSSAVLSQEHLPTASEMIEEKVLKSGIDDSPDKFNELELSKGQIEISTFVGKETDIIEQEDDYNSKDNTLDLGEEKAAIVFREGDQGQRKEVAEIKEKSLLEEKNVEIDDSSETLECATELVNEDQNSQSKMSEAEEDIKDIKQENPTSVEQQVLEQSQEDEITSTKMEATVTNEKVCDEIIKTDSRENNEEQVIENKSTLEELHMISSQGAVNESCQVSEDYMREINSNEKAGTIKSESEEDITSERETTITDTTQEERVMSECMEPPANISVSLAEEPEEKITGEMRNDLEKMHSPSDEATVETPMEADSSFETNAKVAPSLLETQKFMDNPNTSNIPFKISPQASEYEQEVSIDDILSISKDSEIEEKHQGIAVTSLNTTENEYEKTVEESITTENNVPNEEELEQNKFKEDHNQILNEDSNKEDVPEQIDEPLKSTSEVYYQDVVKLSKVIDEGATEKEKADEHRMLEEVTKKESFTDEENNEYLKEEETEVDTENQGKTEAITKEKESRVDTSELKGPENSADNNIISKDIYQVKEIAPEISGNKPTEEISEEGIKTRSVVGDVSPIVNFSPLTESPIENEGQERQDAKEGDREVKEHGDSSKDNLYEVRAEEFIPTDLEKVMSAKEKQSSIIENELVDKTMAENAEQAIKSEGHEDEKIEGAHVGDSGTDEEKGDKHDKDAVSDAPVIVEASKDIDIKVGHKKSHNILSGVGSKVKHSISKVKKAITGKSSHHKSESQK